MGGTLKSIELRWSRVMDEPGLYPQFFFFFLLQKKVTLWKSFSLVLFYYFKQFLKFPNKFTNIKNLSSKWEYKKKDIIYDCLIKNLFNGLKLS